MKLDNEVDWIKALKEFNEKINSEEWQQRELEQRLKWDKERIETERFFMENGYFPTQNKIPKEDYRLQVRYSGIYSKDYKAITILPKA